MYQYMLISHNISIWFLDRSLEGSTHIISKTHLIDLRDMRYVNNYNQFLVLIVNTMKADLLNAHICFR